MRVWKRNVRVEERGLRVWKRLVSDTLDRCQTPHTFGKYGLTPALK
ncbi:MAG: hypothetical protein LBG05_06070 [Treponema sp.]|nr:hypothetical protein [Treponema sp.]